jgi:3-dehydroquinate synthetase
MCQDKKVRHGRLRLVLPTAVGRVAIRDDIDPALIAEILCKPD